VQTRNLHEQCSGAEHSPHSGRPAGADGRSRARAETRAERVAGATGYVDIFHIIQDLLTRPVLSQTTGDETLIPSLEADLRDLHDRAMTARTASWLSDPLDKLGAYIFVRAGSGGTEASDWAAMLLRMYTRWANESSYEGQFSLSCSPLYPKLISRCSSVFSLFTANPVSTIDSTPDPIAGVKSATILIDAPFAHGRLSAETGVHRLVRFSPFNRSGSRHTSFASVRVSPHFPDDGAVSGIEGIRIEPRDLLITTMRSQGAGGQHVNKTESAVRIVHVPTGITVTVYSLSIVGKILR
jgi:peptide chain release factor 2